jgi:CelD/BcsL family acetyltransferase involved in cellulose biosynthesis
MGLNRGLSKILAPFLNMKGFAFSMAEFGLSDGRAPSRAGRPRLVAGVDFAPERSALQVSEFSLEQMDAARAEWSDLASRALEPNAFYEPGFALSAARHFPVRERPRFIVVREASGRMAGLFPVPDTGVLGDGMTGSWLHKQAALATPLVDRDKAESAIRAFLEWIEARSPAAGFVFRRLPADGPFHLALKNVGAAGERQIEILEAYERAALLPGGTIDELCARAGSRKKLAELRRQGRRLREMGRVDFVTYRTATAIRPAAEEFLRLEASGWKAGRGAFLSEAPLATFLRAATRMMALDGRCKIVALRLDGRAIAMGLVLDSQNRSYFWKIAFDESLRSQAPGVQLVYELTQAELARPGLEMVDSCAIANHPLIDRLWPDRIGVCDVAVQLLSGRAADFAASCRRNNARRQIRDIAKRTANRLLKRKVS